jgi:hypothetical protein
MAHFVESEAGNRPLSPAVCDETVDDCGSFTGNFPFLDIRRRARLGSVFS